MMAMVADMLSWLCFLTGGFLGIAGAIGLFRFPDFYTRLHAASVTDTLSVALFVLGLMLQGGASLMLLKLFLVVLILIYTGPTAIHALAKAAREEGLEPLLDDKGEKPSES